MFVKVIKKLNKNKLNSVWNKVGKKVTKRTYFGGVFPDFAKLRISPEVRADPFYGIERTRVVQEELTEKYKPKSADGTVAGRLATELYSRMQLADNLHKTNKFSTAVMDDMPKIEKLKDSELGKRIFFNENPIEKRLDLLDETLTDLNVNFITRYFFAYVLAEQHANQVNNIFAVWSKYMKEKTGIREAKLTTFGQLNEQELNHFRTIIKDALCTPDGTLLLEHVVDPSLLGGFRIEAGGSTIDNSWLPAKKQWDQWKRDEEAAEQQLINSAPKLA